MQKITPVATFEWPTEPGKITASIDFYSNDSVTICGKSANDFYFKMLAHERENGKLPQSEQIEWVKNFTGIEPKTI